MVAAVRRLTRRAISEGRAAPGSIIVRKGSPYPVRRHHKRCRRSEAGEISCAERGAICSSHDSSAAAARVGLTCRRPSPRIKHGSCSHGTHAAGSPRHHHTWGLHAPMRYAIPVLIMLAGCTAGGPPDHPLTATWQGVKTLELSANGYRLGDEFGFWSVDKQTLRLAKDFRWPAC